MERETQSTAPRPQTKRSKVTDWVFLRKIETFVFAFMFLALPFFALKVVHTTTTTLSIKNTIVDLVRDLETWRGTAREKHVEIQLESKPGLNGKPFMYCIKQDGRLVEEVRLPPGVSIIGSVTFSPSGTPAAPSSFLITKGIRSSHVEIDNQGLISAP